MLNAQGLNLAEEFNSSESAVVPAAGVSVSGNHLFEALCDPALTLEEAIALTRAALTANPAADVDVAKRLAEQAHGDMSTAAATRLMQVLAVVSDGNRIMPSLLRLMRRTDKEIRSKAVLMIGRATHSVPWVRARFEDADPRTRASAVEALWGCEGADVRMLLRTARSDPHHRVAANALFGLYALGETRAIIELRQMAAHATPIFRAAAAWAMGKAGDRRFSDILRRLILDPEPSVRKRALIGLLKVRSAVIQSGNGVHWRMGGSMTTLEDTRQLVIEVAPSDRAPLPKLTATQFILTEDGKIIDDYQVDERTVPEIVSLSLLFPGSSSAVSPWIQGALQSLEWKRDSDLWRTIYYLDGEEAEPARNSELTAYTSDRDTLIAGLTKPQQKFGSRGFWSALRNSFRTGQHRGARRLLVYCRTDPGEPEDPEAIIGSIAPQTAVHIIAATSNSTLKELARRSHGSFQTAQEDDDLVTMVEEAYHVILARFLIRYRPTPGSAAPVHVWASNVNGWGEKRLGLSKAQSSDRIAPALSGSRPNLASVPISLHRNEELPTE